MERLQQVIDDVHISRWQSQQQTISIGKHYTHEWASYTHMFMHLIQGEDGKDFELSLEDLSKEEQASFMQAVANGSFDRYITMWEPWWHNTELADLRVSQNGTPLVIGTQPSPYTKIRIGPAIWVSEFRFES